MNPQGLNDKEIGQDILTGEKVLTDLYAQGSVEAADPYLRQLMEQLHSESVHDAGRVFQHLHERGWYGLRPAGFQDINEIRSTIGQTRQALAMNTGQGGMGQPVSQEYFGGINDMMGQGYQQQMGQGQYGGQQNHNLPTWTRQEVPSPSGQQRPFQSQSGYGIPQQQPQQQFRQQQYQPQPQQQYQPQQQQQYQPQQQQQQYQPQYQQQLPGWTRQEVPGESGQRASGGPVGTSAYPGGPTSYYQSNQQQQYQPQQQQQYQPQQQQYQPQYQQQLPNWTRQEVGQQGGYGNQFRQQQ